MPENLDKAQQLRQFKAEIFKLLAHPTRIHILECLRSKEQAVSELLEEVEVEPANLSQHLSLLKARGLVVKRRHEGQILYRLSDPLLSSVLDAMRLYFSKHIKETLSAMDEEQAQG